MIETATATTLPPVRRQTLTERAYEALLPAICSGELPPGRKLVIDALACELGLSITPVREALRQLQREGLVTETPYSGVQVSALSAAEVRELFSVRGVLEGYAVRLATARLGDEDFAAIQVELDALEEAAARVDPALFRSHNTRFHRAIMARGIGDGALADLLGQLTRNTERYRAAGATLDAAYLAAAQAQHRELVALVRQGRADEAEMLVRRHSRTFAEHLARRLEGAG